ncbi:MAG TPA: hypothetical protein PLW97_10820 [Synergistaceae bacterium]|nr:hypothetical protein [Synergistaceae bacterium]HPQ38122.1 hypothetical protein [Synergistaceae bacterium]
MPLERDQVLGFSDIDEGLALRLVLGKEHPWVSIDNKITGKKKSVRMFFVENGKDLQIRTGKGKTETYPHADVVEALKELCLQAMSIPALRERYVQVLGILLTKIHDPRYVTRESDYLVLPDEKRKSLWLGCFSESSAPGVMRPCFSMSPEEKKLMEEMMDEDMPPFGRGFGVPSGERSAKVLKRHGVPQKLIAHLPERWLEPLSIAVAGVFLGMTEWSMDDTLPFMKHIWRPLLDPQFNREGGNAEELKDTSRGLAEILGRYIKMYHALPRMETEEIMDAEDALKEEGYGRRERFDDHSNILGNHVFQLERFIRDDNSTVLVQKIKGQRTMPDTVVRLQPGLYEECLREDACGSVEDSRFTTLQILFGLRISRWLDIARRITGPSVLRK